jgi:hypothetical protein
MAALEDGKIPILLKPIDQGDDMAAILTVDRRHFAAPSPSPGSGPNTLKA